MLAVTEFQCFPLAHHSRACAARTWQRQEWRECLYLTACPPEITGTTHTFASKDHQ
jgi:hypothetical protein